MPAAATPTDLLAIARPFLTMACVAFVLGFTGYLALFQSSAGAPQHRFEPTSASAPTPSPAPEAWNPPKPV